MTATQKKYFTEELMRWHHSANTRSLPWKEEKDPYKIWLSEIILQQTRAQQGLPYYLGFTQAYPDVHALAAAADEEAFRLWQGLGYYNRCKNMLATARYISSQLEGRFPETYEGILALKGIGPYTASAIASFAYGLPCAVVDGNVYRVLSRYFGIDTPFDTTEGKKRFSELAQQLLAKDSAAYNQAIMDLGATVCTPGATARCGDCPLQKKCVAFRHGMVALLPVKSKRTEVKTRYFHYLLLLADGQLWIQKRSAKDIWQNLHEPYLLEATAPLDAAGLVKHPGYRSLPVPKGVSPAYEGMLRQRLSHRVIESHFFTLHLRGTIPMPGDNGNWQPLEQLKNLAFPKTLVSFLEKKLYF